MSSLPPLPPSPLTPNGDEDVDNAATTFPPLSGGAEESVSNDDVETPPPQLFCGLILATMSPESSSLFLSSPAILFYPCASAPNSSTTPYEQRQQQRQQNNEETESVIVSSSSSDEEEEDVSSSSAPQQQQQPTTTTTTSEEEPFKDPIEKFVFETKTLSLRQESFYYSIYQYEESNSERGEISRLYSGPPLFRHFKGLREWVLFVQTVFDGKRYIKDKNEYSSEGEISSCSWKNIHSKDLKLISSRLYSIAPTTKGVLEVSKVQSSLITRKPRGAYEEEDNIGDIFSHNDVFEVEMRIFLKPSNKKSIFYGSSEFIIKSHKTGEYEQDLRPMPRGDFLGSYDPVIDFDEDRAIVFTPWKIMNDEDLPLLILHQHQAMSTTADASSASSTTSTSMSAPHHHTPPPPPVSSSAMCMICIENARSHIAIPCGHFVLCGECCRRTDERCIVCRQNVVKYTTVLT